MRFLSIALVVSLTCLVSTGVSSKPFCSRGHKQECEPGPSVELKKVEPGTKALLACSVPGKWACNDSGGSNYIVVINPDLSGKSTSNDIPCPVADEHIALTGSNTFRETMIVSPGPDCVNSNSQDTFSGDCKSFSGPWVNDAGHTGTWSCQLVQ
jgi:hypothetical protein